MAKTKTVWKVVRVRDGKRISAIVDRKRGGIEYNEPGGPTLPPEGTRLLAFSTRKAALTFNLVTPPSEVWKAEARGVRLLKYLPDPFLPNKFVAFWQTELVTEKDKWPWFPFPAPTGTVSCSELTLIKQVG